MKPKVSIVPKWKPKPPAQIALLKWKLARGHFANDRRERERAESIVADWEASQS